MGDHGLRQGPPLASLLTRRLTLIATAVFILNSVVIGVYYASNSRALDGEVLDYQIAQLEQQLQGTRLPATAEARLLYHEHPDAYAFAIVNRGGQLLESMNNDLIPIGVTDVYADIWMTRFDVADGSFLVGGQEFYTRTDGLRAVFVMKGDPANLLRRAYLAEFYEHVLIPLIPLIIILIGANVILIRKGLEPVSVAAKWARGVRPGRIEAPPDIQLPKEISDLVSATQRSIQRLEQALAVESRRAAEVAHALRTPVAVLIARLDGLPSSEVSSQLRNDVSALARTVKQVLASARAEVLTEKEMIPLDLRKPAEAVVSALAPVAYEQGIELSLDIPDLPVVALAIEEGVELTLFNLIENAILHSGCNMVSVLVGTDAVIRVRDNGNGLPDGFEQNIFKPFWRGENAALGGTGLGMSIVDRLQRIQSGSITAHSPQDGGTEFELRWSTLNTHK